jgi:hypothetical protein
MEKIKITIEYPGLTGETNIVESEYPAARKELLGNILSMIGKFDDGDVTYGFIFLKGEPHPSGALQSIVDVKVSPRLPKANDFKKMIVKKVGSIWKEHMRWAAADNHTAYVPTAEAQEEESMLDYICRGKF